LVVKERMRSSECCHHWLAPEGHQATKTLHQLIHSWNCVLSFHSSPFRPFLLSKKDMVGDGVKEVQLELKAG